MSQPITKRSCKGLTTQYTSSPYYTCGTSSMFDFSDVVDYYDTTADSFWVFTEWSQHNNCYLHSISGIIIELLDGDIPMLYGFDDGVQVQTDLSIPANVSEWAQMCSILTHTSKPLGWVNKLNDLTAWMKEQTRKNNKNSNKRRSFSPVRRNPVRRSTRNNQPIEVDDDYDFTDDIPESEFVE